MIKCPNCGSTAQPQLIDTEYIENGWTIKRIAILKCGCGWLFSTSAIFESDGIEEIEDECL